jgi:predicted glycoside hydrolase/deacetylase ChbG (UPF0249 family)
MLHVPSTFARLAGAWIAACLILAGDVDRASAETWAERLGYPAAAKVLILHAGEMGLSHETNAAGAKLFESGVVRSAAAMAPAPWFADFAEWARAHADADVGLELTLNSELKNYRWQPTASDSLAASLVDADGFLWQSPLQTSSNALIEDVEVELRAQVARAKAAGLRPSHLTSHLGTLFERPDLIDAYLRVAQEAWTPAAVVELTPELVDQLAQDGYPLPEDVVAAMDDYPLPKLDALRFVPDGESYEAKKQAFLRLLGELPAGLTQIAFRPALASDALPRIVDDASQRNWDADLLVDEQVREALRAEGIILTDWREIMRRFEDDGAAPPKPADAAAKAE